MKIKLYTKLTKRNLKINPFIIFLLPLPKPKIPFRLFFNIHMINLYQPPKFIFEAVAVADPLEVGAVAGPLVLAAGPLEVGAVAGPLEVGAVAGPLV